MSSPVGSNQPGVQTPPLPRAPVSGDARAGNLNALKTAYGDVGFGTDGAVLIADSSNPMGVRWGVPSYIPTPTAVAAALPGSPTDGQEIYYLADAAQRILWHLRYNASGGAYKWEFLGGPPLISEVATGETTVSAAYAALTTPGPSVTLPLSGDYIVAIAATAAGSADGYSYMSYDIGGTAAIDADSCFTRDTGGTTFVSGASRERIKSGLTAGQALVSKYKQSTRAGTANFYNRRMRILPIRVA